MTIVLSSLHPSMKSLFLRTQHQRQRFCKSVLWIRMRKTNSSTPCRAASTRWVSRSFVWILQLALFTLWRHWITKPFTSTSSRSWYGSRPLLRPTLQFLKGFMHLGGVLSQENSNRVDHNVDFFFFFRCEIKTSLWSATLRGSWWMSVTRMTTRPGSRVPPTKGGCMNPQLWARRCCRSRRWTRTRAGMPKWCTPSSQVPGEHSRGS